MYRRSFDGPIDTCKLLTLRFDGLDCIADVWLNGVHLGRRENMLIPQEFDITNTVVRGGANDIVVRLGSPIARAADYEYPDSVDAMHVNTEQLFIRKAPHMYGWDIMPRVVSAGIWRGVTLIVHNDYEIDEDHSERMRFRTRMPGCISAGKSTRRLPTGPACNCD